MSVVQFVDSIDGGAVRLNINSGGLMIGAEGIDLSPAPVRRSVSATMLVDGDQISAMAWGNRVVKLPIQLVTETVDAAATQIQALSRELCRDRNTLKVQLGSQAMYFRTYAAPDYAFHMPRLLAQYGKATLEIPAEPFGYGPRETLAPVTVYNDPAVGTPLNANPFFEVNAANWTPTGGTFVRSTAQFHEGVASGLLTPDGVTATVIVRSEAVPATVGSTYRARMWVRCAVARNVDVIIEWLDGGSSVLSTAFATYALAANTWTELVHSGVAVASTVTHRIGARLTGTPAASHTTHIDEATTNLDAGKAMCIDINNVKGDVETPALIQYPWFTMGATGTSPAIGVRRRGTPANMPLVIQAEAMTQGTDTTVQTADASASGGRFSRTTFGTPGLVSRLSIANWPPTPSVDVRGTYHVFARFRKSSGAATFTFQLLWQGGVGANFQGTQAVFSDTDTTWQWIDLGMVSIPTTADPVYVGPSGTQIPARGISNIFVAVQRNSGTSTLDIDHLLWLPADDSLLIWNIPFGGSAIDTVTIDGYNRAVFDTLGDGSLDNLVPHQVVGGFPSLSPGSQVNRLVFALNTKGNIDDITKSAPVTVSYWPRYLTLPTGA